jgi:ergothioneine biosynthesis protein EgtB
MTPQAAAQGLRSASADGGLTQPEALRRYAEVRAASLALTERLSAEDMQVQSMPDVSPTKWHLAHVTWFFETFVLAPHAPGYAPFDPAYGYLFNSYYEAVGERHPRPRRGLLSRPPLSDVLAYRGHVDAAMARLIGEADTAAWRSISPLVELGLNHEQQHQELILMDIKHVLSLNPLAPAYRSGEPVEHAGATALDWLDFDGGLVSVGHEGPGFAFDNEGPRHKVWLEPFRLASRLATCGEYLSFIEDGGYARPELWLSDGWEAVGREGWTAPLYWREGEDSERTVFTLEGPRPLDPEAPVGHLSHYEADAFARWSGRRLPTEQEWETASQYPGLPQMTGALWQWTASPYVAYPRYRPPPGAVGEYNGKFMSGQMVLRGGSGGTPRGHARITYRNFFPPDARWAFSGVRLADDA